MNIEPIINDRKNKHMFRGSFLTFLTAMPLFTFVFCNNVSQPEEVEYGSISGKILYPDSNLLIRIIPEYGNDDTTTRDSVSRMFVFDSVKTGKCILQVSADGYGFHEQKFILNKRQFICHDIALAHTPSVVSYLFPSNSQNFDSLFFSISHSSITDTGIQVIITFNDWMDSASVIKALTILPDSVGVQAELVLKQSLVVYFPYWKLASIDTARVTVGTGAFDRWDDHLEFDYSVFFPVDPDFIRATRLKEK